jgi:gas vesicle protein
MGFIRGVITGVTVAAGAAAWYLSKSGERFREQYRVDRKLGALGDEIEERTRDVRAKAHQQVRELRDGETDPTVAVGEALDESQASAAEAAAALAAATEARAAKVKQRAKDAAEG